jgi:predicted porin
MKKTLIALAVGAALAPAAHADVVLTGVINLGPTVHNTSGGSTGLTNSITSSSANPVGGTTIGLSRNYSWLGVGSTEDLGNGLKLDVFLQFQMEPQGNAGITNRNSRVGFTGESWGGIWYGSNENIYERYLYSTDPLDGAMGVGGNLSILGTPGYGVVFDAPTGKGGPFGTAGFYRRTEHTIWYDSPNWNGFTFGAAYLMPAYNTTCGQTALGNLVTSDPAVNGGALTPGSACQDPNQKINPWGVSVGAKYAGTSIPLEVWAAYERHKDFFGMAAIGFAGGANTGVSAVGTSATDTGIQAGVAYTLGDVRLFALFEQLKYKHDGAPVGDLSEYKRNAWGAGLKWNLASGYVGAQYLQANNASCTFNDGTQCNADNTGARLIGAGYFHNLSKQTQVYLVGARINNKDLASFAPAGALGVYNNGVLPGQNITSFTVGVKHSF